MVFKFKIRVQTSIFKAFWEDYDMSKTWENIQDEIDKCRRCIEKGHRHVSVKRNKKHPRWMPKNVKTLFVTEAPPSSGKYFYEPERDNRNKNMRDVLFEILNISDIHEFRTKGYFLIDSVKCPSEKDGRNWKPLKKVIKECNCYLKREIESINPDKICILGSSALYSVLNIYSIIPLNKSKRIKDNRERRNRKYIKIGNKECRIIITYFPSYINGINKITEDIEDIKEIIL